MTLTKTQLKAIFNTAEKDVYYFSIADMAHRIGFSQHMLRKYLPAMRRYRVTCEDGIKYRFASGSLGPYRSSSQYMIFTEVKPTE